MNKATILTKPLGFILPVVLVFKSEGWVVKRGREECEQQAEDNKRDCYKNNHTVNIWILNHAKLLSGHKCTYLYGGLVVIVGIQQQLLHII